MAVLKKINNIHLTSQWGMHVLIDAASTPQENEINAGGAVGKVGNSVAYNSSTLLLLYRVFNCCTRVCRKSTPTVCTVV